MQLSPNWIKNKTTCLIMHTVTTNLNHAYKQLILARGIIRKVFMSRCY